MSPEHRPALHITVAPQCPWGRRCSAGKDWWLAPATLPGHHRTPLAASGDLVWVRRRMRDLLSSTWPEGCLAGLLCFSACPELQSQRPVSRAVSPVLPPRAGKTRSPETRSPRFRSPPRVGSHSLLSWLRIPDTHSSAFKTLGDSEGRRKKRIHTRQYNQSDRLVWKTQCNSDGLESVKLAGFGGWGPRSGGLVGWGAFSSLKPRPHPQTDLQEQPQRKWDDSVS